MWSEETEARWQQLADEVLLGVKEWRQQHPRATLTEIEQALDERWATARARLLQDLALASAAADLTAAATAARPRCPQCDRVLEARGMETRQVVTSYEQPVQLRRSYASCPSCGTGLFPPG